MIKSEWEKFGRDNPYFLVITLDKFESKNLSEDALQEFFKTGFDYIERIWTDIEKHFEQDFSPKNALDFGCGVGRLVLPIAERAETVVGIDISDNMLLKAAENSKRMGFENTEFFQTDDFFEKNQKTYDLIHSTIVFQHIKPDDGLELFEKLLAVLNENGIGVIQFAYENPSPKLSALRFKIYRDFPIIYSIRNFIKRSDTPLLPIYEYNLNKIFSILQRNNCHQCYVNFSFHGMHGLVIFFQKKKGFVY